MEDKTFDLPQGFNSRRTKQALEALAILEGVSADLLAMELHWERAEAESMLKWMESCGFLTRNEGKKQYRVTLTKEAYLAFCDRYYPFADGEERPSFRLLHSAPPCPSPIEAVEEKDVVLDLTPEICKQALDCVLNEGAVSISLLQRKLSIGYPRAGRLIEWMEREGYVSPFDGTRARRLLITKEQYDEFVHKYFGSERGEQ